jgi:hypothetical protein
MLVTDGNFHNTETVKYHDQIMESCSTWANHYNFMAGLPWISDVERIIYEEELREYICYDV